MNLEQLLQNYPLRHIKPVNGMAVTAEVWEEAHDYHHKSQGIQAVLGRGPGVLAGLEVIASDPPDTSVYVLPGMALDPAGQIIVLPQAVAYDIGYDMEGLLYIMLSYGESKPKIMGSVDDEDSAPRYVESEFSITAHTSLPNTPGVELARVNRSSRESVLIDAKNFVAPGPDEIDLRFRREINGPREMTMAIGYLGDVPNNKCGRGAMFLAQALSQQNLYRVIIEDGATIGPSIVTNTLVYLVGQGEFELSSGIMNGLRNYVQRAHGTLFIESLDEKAASIFQDFLKTVDLTPKSIEPGHRLLTNPHLFAAPPVGYETEGNLQLLVRDGVVFSTHQYGLLWQGERNGRLATREEIRTAIEWGSNIVAYAEERRRLSG